MSGMDANKTASQICTQVKRTEHPGSHACTHGGKGTGSKETYRKGAK